MKIIYSDEYYVDIGEHVFPTQKYKGVYERLIKANPALKDIIIKPIPASDEDVLLVHTKEYVQKLLTGTLSYEDILTLELPYSKQLVTASWLGAGGTIMAYRYAIKEGAGINLAGGFHHAFSDHGEGFCVLNDIAIGVKKMQKEGLIKRVLILDCDLHQGNGTAAIFANDPTVFTFSIHQENNYPYYKPPGSLDIGLADGTGDEEYLKQMSTHVPRIVQDFKPELIVYVAGADTYEDDQLGGLNLTKEGLKKRDKFVFDLAKPNHIPVAGLLAGGYANDVNDTIEIHYNMVMEALGTVPFTG